MQTNTSRPSSGYRSEVECGVVRPVGRVL